MTPAFAPFRCSSMISHRASAALATGAPVRVLRTPLSQLFWNAITLREHLWHRRRMDGKLAGIRHGKPARSPTWGRATAGAVRTGPAALLGIDTDIESQLDAAIAKQENLF